MNEYWKSVFAQFTAIILAAIGAALIAFFSSIAGSVGLECSPAPSPEKAATFGALFKGIHSAFMLHRGTMLT